MSDVDFEGMITKDLQTNVKSLATKVYNKIVARTPVDTGQARASWNMSKNNPDFSTVDTGRGLPAPEAPKITFAGGEYPLIHISNGKPYIWRLENGWSGQAPAGMVQVTLDELRN